MGRQLAVIHSYTDLVAAFRLRIAQLGTTHEGVDEISGLTPGYTSKLLSDPPIRNIGVMSFDVLLATLGMKLIAVEDPEARVPDRLPLRKHRRHRMPHRSASALAQIRQWAAEGGRKRIASMTDEERHAFHSAGGKARWKAHRRQLAERRRQAA